MRRLFAILCCSAVVSSAAVEKAHCQRSGIASGERTAARINWRDYPEVSPFQGVRWQESAPEVLVDGTWYGLVSVDNLTSSKIVDRCKSLDTKDWQKRFEEDLAAVLIQMGWTFKNEVSLTLRGLDSGKTITMRHVGLTGDNRKAIVQARQDNSLRRANGGQNQTGPASMASRDTPHWQSFPRRAPFEAVRWNSERPEVRLGGEWYELLKLNGISASEITATCKALDDDDWEKRFEEDLVEVLSRMGHKCGDIVTLELKELRTQRLTSLKNVAMTEANRDILRRARSNREELEKNAVLTRKQAEDDIDALQHAIEMQYAYLDRQKVDYRTRLSQIRDQLSDSNRQENLKIALTKVIAAFGDGHSGVADLDEALGPDFLPFLIEDSQGSIVAFKTDRSDFLDPQFPFLKSLDGTPIEQWVDKARPMVAAGSPQYVRRASVHFVRFLGFLRGELNLPASKKVRVEVTSGNNTSSKTIEMEIANSKPLYGEWPRSSSHVFKDDNIGYLRLGSMADGEMFLSGITRSMHEFRNTRGLIIDVRGNGGGLRDGLRTLFPFFMRPDDAPRVVNVAAYRKLPNDASASEGFLADRSLFPITSRVWAPEERSVLEQFAKTFQPEWKPPADKFSDWHFSMISSSKRDDVYHYDRPVMILMDSSCFSATDIFLGAFKGWKNVTLMGSASGGGSGRPHEVKLPYGSIHVKLSTMASFQPVGQLYDGRGISPDVDIPTKPSDIIGRTDSVLDAARRRLR